MTAEEFRRSPRRNGPQLPSGEVRLEAPPAMPEPPKGGLKKFLFMAPMGLMPLGMVVSLMAKGGAAVIGQGFMGMGMMGMMLSQMMRQATGGDQTDVNDERDDYLRYLEGERKRVRAAADEQRLALDWPNPEPRSLPYLVRSPRLWERVANDDDFGEVKIGRGPQDHALDISPPEVVGLDELDPVSAKSLRRFVSHYSRVPDLPLAVSLRAFARILIAGDPEVRRGLARAMLSHTATFHSPEHLRIAVCCSLERQDDWDWVKWLPHNQHPTEDDGIGPKRLFANSVSELERDTLKEIVGDRGRFEPHAAISRDDPLIVIIVDGENVLPMSRLASSGYRNVVTIDLDGGLPWRVDQLALRLRAEPGDLSVAVADRSGTDLEEVLGVPDQFSPAQARALAKGLAKWRVSRDSVDGGTSTSREHDLCDLLGIDNPRTFNPKEYWRVNGPSARLRVPIGVDDNGTPIDLDIRESAQGGMGPHGMLVGATGSGKSELLRTLVTAMALKHSSEFLNFVLVDFKGGATFVGLEKLPHTSALITNLSDELPLVDRMQDAIHGELVRRQELLRATGYASLLDYERARASGISLEPLPTLFLVIDEFSELLAVRREFINLFVMVGRLGRSLGVHLLLATQRIEEGRVNALEGHLSYRIGLKTFSAGESRSVLGVTDAFETPLEPGMGFLKTTQSSLQKFRGGYVSGALPAETVIGEERMAPAHRADLFDFVPNFVAPPEPEEEDPATKPAVPVRDPEAPIAREDVMMHVLIDRLKGSGPDAHRVWLPPLTTSTPLNQLIGPVKVDLKRGLTALKVGDRLRVPVGIIDKPFEQKWETLEADLAGAHGNIGIVGGPQSGKSTMLRTLILSLCLVNTPKEVNFYCLDFSSGSLGSLSGLPHVGSVGNRRDSDLVTRTVLEVAALVDRREASFAAAGIDSMADARRLRSAGKAPAEDDLADVFLVVDGWLTVRQEFESLEAIFQRILARGLSYGVHLVVTAARWSDIRLWLRDALGTKFELHLGDAADSVIGRRAAANVPAIPGRGLTAESLHFLASVPRLDGQSDPATMSQATAQAVQQLAEAWPGQKAPSVRTLPTLLRAEELPPPQGGGDAKADLRVAIGLDEASVQPYWWDFGQHPHLVAFGDTETGKTALLRMIIKAVLARYTCDQAKFILGDFRRELVELIPKEYLIGFATSEEHLKNWMNQSKAAYTARLPAEDMPLDELKKRQWWQGPRVFHIVDDLDLISRPALGSASVMEPLVAGMPQGADIGMHVIVTRSTSGGARGVRDAAVARMWDLGIPALLLSCPREEGTFFGSVKPRTLPPGRAQLITRRGASLIQLGFPMDEPQETPR